MSEATYAIHKNIVTFIYILYFKFSVITFSSKRCTCHIVIFRVNFKLLLLVFKCFYGLGPSYLSDLLTPYKPSRILRSSGSYETRTHDETSFHYCGPHPWNKLPVGPRVFKSEILKCKFLTQHYITLLISIVIYLAFK